MEAATETPSSQQDWEKCARARELFYFARNHRRPLLERWVKNYEVLHNRVWSDNRAKWLPSPRVAEIYPIVASIVAWECDSSPVFDVVPSADPNSPYYTQQAVVANDLRTTLRSAWSLNDMETEVQKFIWDANVYGTGISKVVWDNSAADGYGDVRLTRVDPFRFYPDPAAEDMASARFFIETHELSDEELEERFPGSLKKIKNFSEGPAERSPTQLSNANEKLPKANPGPISPNTSMAYGLPGQGRETTDIDSNTHLILEVWHRCSPENRNKGDYEKSERNEPAEGTAEDVYEDRAETKYEKDSDSWYWRCTVVCGDAVLLDSPAEDLWAHGQHPYDRLVCQDEGEFWGMSLVELLAPLQTSVNRLLAAVEQNIWLAGNPVLLEPVQSGLERTRITNRPGQRLQINTPAAKPEWMNPPVIQPQLAMQLIQFYVGEMERISGLSAIVRGATPGGRNAQGVLDSVQEAAFVRIRAMLRNLEAMLKSSGQKAASLIAEFYDSPRVIAFVGPSGEQNLAALGARHFYTWNPESPAPTPIRFQLQVQAGSTIPTSRQARAAEADTLFAMGAIDEEAVLQAHDFPNWPMIVDRVREMKAANGTLGMPPGARAAAGRTL